MFFTFLFFYIFVYNAPEITVTDDLVALLQQEIALVFIGRFRCGFPRFFAEDKRFPENGTVFKIIARGRYDWCPNGRKNFENLRKWVQSSHHFDHLEAR